MIKGYLANGLFSEAELLYNAYVEKYIYDKLGSDCVELFLPQNAEINDKNGFADSKMISEIDEEKLMNSDFLIAIIDGVEIDSGVSAEIGMFYVTGKPIIALYTDSRQMGTDNKQKIDALIADPTENQFMYRNLFTMGLIKRNGVVVKNLEELCRSIEDIM